MVLNAASGTCQNLHPTGSSSRGPSDIISPDSVYDIWFMVHLDVNLNWLCSFTLKIWVAGFDLQYIPLIHWGRVAHICVGKLTIIGSDNGLSPGRHQAIIWTNAGKLLIGNKLQWNFNRNSNIFIEENTFENVVGEILLISSRPQCVKYIPGFVMRYCVLLWLYHQ